MSLVTTGRARRRREAKLHRPPACGRLDGDVKSRQDAVLFDNEATSSSVR